MDFHYLALSLSLLSSPHLSPLCYPQVCLLLSEFHITECQVESGRWRVESGEQRVESGERGGCIRTSFQMERNHIVF